jgi:hypothetical protein
VLFFTPAIKAVSSTIQLNILRVGFSGARIVVRSSGLDRTGKALRRMVEGERRVTRCRGERWWMVGDFVIDLVNDGGMGAQRRARLSVVGRRTMPQSRWSLRARTWWVRVFVAAGERVRISLVLRGTPWPWFAEGSECLSRDNVKSSRTWVVGSPEWRSAQATAPAAYTSLAKPSTLEVPFSKAA